MGGKRKVINSQGIVERKMTAKSSIKEKKEKKKKEIAAFGKVR